MHYHVFCNLRIFAVLYIPCLLALLLIGCSENNDYAHKYEKRGRKVEIVAENGKYTLLKDGRPYVIKGAAGYEYFNRLQRYGGNSVRVWHTDNAQQVLDSAHANGLTVTLGLWLAREREGFNYYDKELVEEQLQKLKQEVIKYKDHPALLMWGIGNELYADGANVKVWNAVNEVAEMIKEVDPDHPTTTTVMNVPYKVINLIADRCPALDVLSINSFGALFSLREELEKTDWKGPYIISEFGALGYWESYMTSWQAPIEQTSSEKAEFARERYLKSIASNTDRCLGSYVFLWGNKQETTPTWFSLMSEKGEETALVHVMRQLWGDTTTTNKPPYIAYVTLDKKFAYDQIFLQPGNTYQATVFTFDPENDSLTAKWEVLSESEELDGNADKQVRPKPIAGALIEQNSNKVTLKAPKKEGAYRLYVYVYDGHNNIATANTPFYVTENPLQKN
jgi:hypothetical protein